MDDNIKFHFRNEKLESDMKDFIKKLELANNQIGNLTGETTTLRNNNCVKDDQIKNLQDKLKRQEAEILDQRAVSISIMVKSNLFLKATQRTPKKCRLRQVVFCVI